MLYTINSLNELKLTIALIDEKMKTRLWDNYDKGANYDDHVLISLKNIFLDVIKSSNECFLNETNTVDLIYNSLMLKSINDFTDFISTNEHLIYYNKILQLVRLVNDNPDKFNTFVDDLYNDIVLISTHIRDNYYEETNVWPYIESYAKILSVLEDPNDGLRKAFLYLAIKGSVDNIKTAFDFQDSEVDDNSEVMLDKIEDFDEFVKRLLAVNELGDGVVTYDGNDYIDIEATDYGLYISIDDFLIDNNSTPNHRVIKELNYYNIMVGPGETDSFGWLTGVIKLPNGKKIMFG